MDKRYLLEVYDNISTFIYFLNGGSVGFMLTFGVAYVFERQKHDISTQKKLKIMTIISIITLIVTSLFLLFAPSVVLMAKLLGIKY
ncbi:MAG: hypothetical protein ACRDDY_03705 [Clostridium sp.]|uniref:hypothetical protein n=1 Tax=Clostridium sp. TaxID=1506 RepID=UPI003EE5C199